MHTRRSVEGIGGGDGMSRWSGHCLCTVHVYPDTHIGLHEMSANLA